MEERIIDRDKRIKLKKTEDGVDAVEDDGIETSEEEVYEEELVLEMPEDEEYDDDLVGLTPTQLKKRLAERKRAEEKARAEYEKLIAEGDALLKSKDYAAAEPLFAKAAAYENDDLGASRKLWIARTKNYRNAELFYKKGVAREFSRADDEVRAEVLEEMGDELRAARERYREEAEPIRARYTVSKSERAGAFRSNKNYYLLRFLIVLGVLALFGIACGVSSTYIIHTQDSLPLILTIAFGAAAFLTFCVLVFFARKLFVAWRLVRDNEKPSSTADGARLAELDGFIACLDLVLGE